MPIFAGLLLSALSAYPQADTQRSLAVRMQASDLAALRQALGAYDRGDLAAAEQALRNLAARFPREYEVNEALGDLYAESGDVTRALPYLKVAAAGSPKAAIAHANLGAAYLKLGNTQDAVRELEIAVKLDAHNGTTQSNLGRALLASGQTEAASQALGRAVALAPDNNDIRYNWASALFDAGHVPEAAQAIASIPNQETSAQAQALLGDIAERQGQFTDAVEHLQAAAKLDPSEVNIYFLGFEFLRHWTFEPAIRIFEYGVKQYPSSQRLLMGLGIARYAMNDLALAAPIFAQLLDMDPESANYADFLGKSCNLMPDLSQGCEKLKDFAQNHPKNATIATYAASSILHRSTQTDDLIDAGKLLQQAIALDPQLAEAHFQMGLLLQLQAKWQESIPELETAIALKPHSSKTHYRLAMAYSHTGQREKAQEEIVLQKRYNEEEKNSLNVRLGEVKTFLVTSP